MSEPKFYPQFQILHRCVVFTLWAKPINIHGKGGKNYENALYRTTFQYCDQLEDRNAQRERDGRRATKAMGYDGGDGWLMITMGIDHRPNFPLPPSNLWYKKVGGISSKINKLFKFTHGKKNSNFPNYFVGK